MVEMTTLPRMRGEEVRVPSGAVGHVTGFLLQDQLVVLVTHSDADAPEVEYFDEPYWPHELQSADDLPVGHRPSRRAD